jgi:phosphoribosyl-AMP cyclohydrolase
MTTAWIDEVAWNSDGLVTAVAQEVATGDVLMVAWMNRESLRLTLSEGYAVYWSRSRQRLWRKGEESGHRQKLLEIRLDCDGDALLLKVEQVGGIACHTGRHHCFFRRLQGEVWKTVDAVLKSPDDIYHR